MVGLDEVDRDILKILQEKGRVSYTELGDKIGVSDVAAKKRVIKLVEEGVIERFTVEVNHSKMDKPLHAFLLVKLSPSLVPDLMKELGENEDVLRVYNSIGEYDMVIETVCKDIDELKRINERVIGNLRGVQEIRTSITVDKC